MAMSIKKKSNSLITFLLCLGLAGCGHLHMNWSNQNMTGPSDYRDYRSSLLWGFSAARQLDFSKLCEAQTPLKITTYYNFEDVLFALISFGFYTSQTVEVWCPQSKKSASF